MKALCLERTVCPQLKAGLIRYTHVVMHKFCGKVLKHKVQNSRLLPICCRDSYLTFHERHMAEFVREHA